MEYDDRFVNYLGFFYIAEENIFIDEDGGIVYNIFDFVPPQVVAEFKELRKTIVYEKTRTDIIELYYPQTNDEIQFLQEEYKRKVYDEDDAKDYNGPECAVKEDDQNETGAS